MGLKEDVEELIEKYEMKEVLACVVDITQERNALAILKRLTESLWAS
ncbi:MAG: hypothetical protein GY870_13000 [archaeon]|nr:hypothetical protein [archaeon]